MSVERAELPGEDDQRSWKERLAEVASAGRTLIATRLAIFQEEASAKAVFAARGFAGFVIAAAFAVGAVLLAGALLAAILFEVTKSLILGILLASVVYAVAAAAAAWLGWKSMSKVRPFDFPAVSAELSRDAAAISDALTPPEVWEEEEAVPGTEADVADLEDRLRRGSE